MNGEGQFKKLHGQFLRDMDEKASENSWLIVAKERISEERHGRVFGGCPESGTESQCYKCQDRSVTRELIVSSEPSESDTVKHIVSAWHKIAQTQ